MFSKGALRLVSVRPFVAHFLWARVRGAHIERDGKERPKRTPSHAAHKSWSIQLHYDNLVALAGTRPELKPMPSYPTLRRFMRVNGLDKRRRVTSRQTDGADRAEDKLADREIRGYEAEYVGSLWHWDCHNGSKKVLTGRGEWVTPILFGVLDDRSRLACHLQWYLAETAEIIAHGLSQAFRKRGLGNPRALMNIAGELLAAAHAGMDLISPKARLRFATFAGGLGSSVSEAA
jgi:hypothetical protein